MKLCCPVCQSRFDLEHAANTEALREMVALAAKFGSAWQLVDEYVNAFRQEIFASLTLKRRMRLIKEIQRLWESCEFRYQGKRYRTDHARIRQAMTAVCNAEKFGFRNHNYLKRILMKEAKRLSAEGFTAEEEKKKLIAHSSRLTGKQKREEISAEEFKRRHDIQNLGDQAVKEMP